MAFSCFSLSPSSFGVPLSPSCSLSANTLYVSSHDALLPPQIFFRVPHLLFVFNYHHYANDFQSKPVVQQELSWSSDPHIYVLWDVWQVPQLQHPQKIYLILSKTYYLLVFYCQWMAPSSTQARTQGGNTSSSLNSHQPLTLPVIRCHVCLLAAHLYFFFTSSQLLPSFRYLPQLDLL